jgi:hypothetical protein
MSTDNTHYMAKKISENGWFWAMINEEESQVGST